ncbi:MAG: membrane protein insertase YidC, partial [Gemmatimonadetes bacterium]
ISWKLKKHFNTQLPEDLPEEERWLELIPQDRRGALQLGFFELNDLPASEIYNLMDATWFVDRTGVIEVTNTPQTVVFTLNRFGLQLTKTLTFYPGQYSFDLGVDLQGISSDEWEYYEITWHPGMNSTEKNYKDDTNFFAGISNVGNRINTKMLRKIQKQEKIVIGDQHRAQDEVIWSGLKTKYFTAVVIPEEPGVEVRFGGSKMNAHYIDFELVVPAYVSTFRVYVGPIDFDGLKAEGHQLEKLLDLGKYIGFISRPMLELFLFLHQFIPNYGIIIILFSIMMKTVFYPFNKSSYTSMRKMQEIQPKMKELQEKYKNNPQQLQKEMMELYKEHGVNPLSGCLPMLPQIPIFFALFRVLRATVELRSAGFIPIWLEDLSQPDPFYALPIMMGITMFIQQKTSPQSAAAATNPQQKMMMYILPFVMTFMFLNFQAGLVLYWFTNNILTVIQQYMITHSHTKSQQA